MVKTTSHNTALHAAFFKPMFDALASASNTYKCKVMPDETWIESCVRRCVGFSQSGRHHLQFLSDKLDTEIAGNTFFEGLKSDRRHRLNAEINESLLSRLRESIVDPFSHVDVDPTQSLKDFDLYAGDGHFHAAACHDDSFPGKVPGTTRKFPAGHLYALDLRTQGLRHLTVLDQVERLHEHDMRALKRMNVNTLRQGAPVGRKVLYVWDRAGIDFHQWKVWKGNAIYFLSREKESMNIQVLGEHVLDKTAAINEGVISDQLVSPATFGSTLRRVIYRDPATGVLYHFLTNLPTSVPPGLVALLYGRRWDIEKIFDEMKNKMVEKKAWGKSPEAKSAQAVATCISHNLMTLMDNELAVKEGIRNVAEEKRKAKRFENSKKKLEAEGKRMPKVLDFFQRLTVRTVKFIRWLQNHLDLAVSWEKCLKALVRIYSKL